MGPPAFLKSARFGNDDVTDQTFDVSAHPGPYRPWRPATGLERQASRFQRTLYHSEPGPRKISRRFRRTRIPGAWHGDQEITLAEPEPATVDFSQDNKL